MKDKLKDFIAKLYTFLKPYKNTIIIPVLKILGIVIICALLVHFIGGHETLKQYADKNPDIAYQTASTDDK
jgi:hypothetical protein